MVHEMEVLGPLRKKLSLEKDMAKLRVTLKSPSILDFEEDLNNLPILKHINQPNNPIYLVFSPGIVRIQTTCYFKSEKMKSLYTVKSETPNYTYFASFLDTKIKLDGDSSVKDVSSRLLTFSQKSELF